MLKPGLIACLIAMLVDSLRGCNCVDHVLVDFDGGRVVPGYITKLSRTHFRNDLVVKNKILCDILY